MEISKEELEIIEKRLNSPYVRYFKRIFDITASLLALILLSPVFLVIAVIIKITSPGPVIFKQERVGRNFKKFTLYKFRSMRVGSERNGAGVTFAGDPRITGIGSFLRKTKLDELPQFFNVLKGDMSLVGPRAVLEKFVIPFKDDYEIILRVRPGLTDYATLYYTEEEELLKGKGSTPEEIEDYYIRHIHSEKVRFYYRYLKEISFSTDLKILFLTALKLFRGIWNRIIKAGKEKVLYLIGDLTVLTVAYIVTFYLRFDFHIPHKHFVNMWKGLAFFVPSGVLSFLLFRIYRIGWKASSINLIELIKAVGLTFLLFGLAVLSLRHNFFSSFPRSIIFLAPITGLAFIKGYRVIIDQFRDFSRGGTRTILTGDAEKEEFERVITAFEKISDFFDIVGILSRSEDDVGKSFENRKVIGTFEDIFNVVEREAINSIFILPSRETTIKGESFLRVREITGKNLFTFDPLYYRLFFPDNLQSWIEPLDFEFLFRRLIYNKEFDEKLKEKIGGKKVLIYGGDSASFLGTLLFHLLLLGSKRVDIVATDPFEAWELDRLFKNRCVNCRSEVKFHVSAKSVCGEEVTALYREVRPDYVFYLDTFRESEITQFVSADDLIRRNVLFPFKLADAMNNNSPFIYLSGGVSSFARDVGVTLRIAESLLRRYKNVYLLRAGRLAGAGNRFFEFLQQVARGMIKINFSIPDIKFDLVSAHDLSFALMLILFEEPGIYLYRSGYTFRISQLLKLIGGVINPSVSVNVNFDGEDEDKLFSGSEGLERFGEGLFKVETPFKLKEEDVKRLLSDNEFIATLAKQLDI